MKVLYIFIVILYLSSASFAQFITYKDDYRIEAIINQIDSQNPDSLLVAQIQKLLKEYNLYFGQITGNFDSQTSEAMLKFQFDLDEAKATEEERLLLTKQEQSDTIDTVLVVAETTEPLTELTPIQQLDSLRSLIKKQQALIDSAKQNIDSTRQLINTLNKPKAKKVKQTRLQTPLSSLAAIQGYSGYSGITGYEGYSGINGYSGIGVIRPSYNDYIDSNYLIKNLDPISIQQFLSGINLPSREMTGQALTYSIIGWYEKRTGLKVNPTIANTQNKHQERARFIFTVGQLVGTDAYELLAIAHSESNWPRGWILNPRARNTRSSATGIFQVLNATWDMTTTNLFGQKIPRDLRKDFFVNVLVGAYIHVTKNPHQEWPQNVETWTRKARTMKNDYIGNRILPWKNKKYF